MNIAINCLRTNELEEQQLKKINSTTCRNVNFSKRNDKQRDKKDKRVSRDISCKFCYKNMNLAKNFLQLGEKTVNCAKLKITFKVSLFTKKPKNRKRQTKIIQQILQKVIIIVEMNHSLQ